MKHTTKSIIIGRMKRPNKEEEVYPCFISLFDINDPHKTGEVPKKKLEYERIEKVIIKGLDINYLLAGNDLLINDLQEVEIDKEDCILHIKGVQE